MNDYLIKCLLLVTPTVLGMTIVVLLAMRLITGDSGRGAVEFSGVGTPPLSWGYDLKSGVPLIQINPWLSIFPGVAIRLTVPGFNLFGDGWRDALDPRLKP
jgi:ABC-type dipeptide/oligopeptide/nickel transport system permease subunit